MNSNDNNSISQENKKLVFKEIELRFNKLVEEIKALIPGRGGEKSASNIQKELDALYLKTQKLGDDGLVLGIKIRDLFNLIEEFQNISRKSRPSILGEILKREKASNALTSLTQAPREPREHRDRGN